MSIKVFNFLVYLWIAIALVIFPVVLRNVAPYGRHTTRRWGSLVPNRAGWMIMESPALLVFAGFYLFGTAVHTPVTWFFFGCWMLHYLNRTLVYPFRLRTPGKRIPVVIIFMALGFNLMNGFINGYYLGFLATQYTRSWLMDPRFISGLVIFVTGMYINWQSDHLLIHLRKPGESGYQIPRRGLFRYISCPNHFGEIIEWSGFAVMTWCTPALAFAIWTLVNLLPRALHHHRWYHKTFPDYPPKRKALIPYIL